MIDNAYFEDRLTTETFDRTAAQRARRTEIASGLYEGKHDDSFVQREVNRRMFVEFAAELEEAIDEHAAEISRTAYERHEPLSPDAAHLVARMEVMDELARLHEELPLPGLERIAQQYDNA